MSSCRIGPVLPGRGMDAREGKKHACNEKYLMFPVEIPGLDDQDFSTLLELNISDSMCADLVAYSPRSSDSVVEVTLISNSPSVDEDVPKEDLKMEDECKGEHHQTLMTSKIENTDATEIPDFVSNGHLSSRSEYEHRKQSDCVENFKDHFDKVMKEFNHYISKIKSRDHEKDIALMETELFKQHEYRFHVEDSSEPEASKPRSTRLLAADLIDDVSQDVSECHLMLHSLLKLKNRKEDQNLQIHHVNSRPAKSTSCCSCENFDCKKDVSCDDFAEKVTLYGIKFFYKEAGLSDSEREHCKTTDRSEYVALFQICSPRSKQGIFQDENFAAKGDCGEIDKLATKLKNQRISSKCMTTKPAENITNNKQYDIENLSARLRDKTESEYGTASIPKSCQPSDLHVYPEARKICVKLSSLQAALQSALEIQFGGVNVCDGMSVEEMCKLIVQNTFNKLLVPEKCNAGGKANQNSWTEYKEKCVDRKDESEFVQLNRCDCHGVERRSEVFGSALLDDVDPLSDGNVLQSGDTRSGAPDSREVGRPAASDRGDSKDETAGSNTATPRAVEEDGDENREIEKRNGRTQDAGRLLSRKLHCGAAGDGLPGETARRESPRVGPDLDAAPSASTLDVWSVTSATGSSVSATSPCCHAAGDPETARRESSVAGPRPSPSASTLDVWSVPSATGSSVSTTSSCCRSQASSRSWARWCRWCRCRRGGAVARRRLCRARLRVADLADAVRRDQLQLALAGSEEGAVRQAARRLLQLLQHKQLEGKALLVTSRAP